MRERINQNLSPEYRGPSLEALKSEQDYDNKDSVYLNFYQVVQTLSLYLGPRVSRLETVNSDLAPLNQNLSTERRPFHARNASIQQKREIPHYADG